MDQLDKDLEAALRPCESLAAKQFKPGRVEIHVSQDRLRVLLMAAFAAGCAHARGEPIGPKDGN